MSGPCHLGQSAETLAALIRGSLQIGHHRVAMQRILMLHRLQGSLPPEFEAVLAEGSRRVAARDLRRMRQAADAWASMLGRGRAW